MDIISKKRILIALAAALLIAFAGSSLSYYLDNHRTIIITTDSAPIDVQIDDKIYTVREPKQKVIVNKSFHNYRSVKVVEGVRIVLTGDTDLVQNKSVAIGINYKIYTKQSIADALCKDSSTKQSKCLFVPQDLTVTYAEKHTYSVALINNNVVDKGLAVLRIENGAWKVIAGPGTDLLIDGFYPQSVEEIIKHAK